MWIKATEKYPSHGKHLGKVDGGRKTTLTFSKHAISDSQGKCYRTDEVEWFDELQVFTLEDMERCFYAGRDTTLNSTEHVYRNFDEYQADVLKK